MYVLSADSAKLSDCSSSAVSNNCCLADKLTSSASRALARAANRLTSSRRCVDVTPNLAADADTFASCRLLLNSGKSTWTPTLR